MRERLKQYFHNKNNVINLAIWFLGSFFIIFILECLNRDSLKYGIMFLKDRTWVFILNYCIFLSLTSICFLFKKTRFVYSIISIILTNFYIGSIILEQFRGTPLIWADLYSIKDGISIAKKYLDLKIIILFIIAMVAIVGILIYTWKTERKEEYHNKIKAIVIIISTIIITNFILLYNKNIDELRIYKWDIPLTYRENGFLYSFLYTASGFKVEEPKVYDENSINEIKNNLLEIHKLAIENNLRLKDTTEKPNIIIVQLESFFDPYRLNDVKFNKDPIPYFREFYNNSTHGYVDVPTFGGGTVRSEFEVLTGLNTDFLPVGEIPNNNILKRQPVESIAYILGEKGYTSSVVHNYEGNFYDRDIVFANLGFDNYVSMEYMDKPKNDLSIYYPEDILNLQPVKELLSKDEAQFIYNITVESHGGYDKDIKSLEYTVSGDISDKDKKQIQFYVEKLKGVDRYVKELMDYVNTLNEPTIVAMFSDHLPSLDIINENLNILDKGIYKAEYFIWDNIGLEKKKEDIQAYQLGYHIFDTIGLNGGIMTTFHKAYLNKEDYEKKFQKLQYDILFGQKYITNGKNIYSKSNLKLGLDEIKITDYYIDENNIVVNGENFTSHSKIIVNGKMLETTFRGKNTLESNIKLSKINDISIGQLGKNNKILSESNTIYIN